MNDIMDHRIATIHYSLARIREVYNRAEDNFNTDLTSQDSIIFNLQRACQASIDIANYFNKKLFSKFPKDNHDSFETLHKEGLITTKLALNLQELVDFSRLLVRDYQMLNLKIMKHVVERRLTDFESFINSVKEPEAQPTVRIASRL